MATDLPARRARDLPVQREPLRARARRVPDPWLVDRPDELPAAELRLDELTRIERDTAVALSGPTAHRTNATLIGITTRADLAQPLRIYQDPVRRRTRAEIVATLRLSGSVAVWAVCATLFVAVMLIAVAIVARAYDVAQWIAP